MRYADTAPTLNYSVGESALAPVFTQSGSFLRQTDELLVEDKPAELR